jgi:hypothetical protein
MSCACQSANFQGPDSIESAIHGQSTLARSNRFGGIALVVAGIIRLKGRAH